MTGLGTPLANLLVPDLMAYHGPGTSYSGPTVAGLQNTGLVNTGTSDGGPMDVFSVFDALTLAGDELGYSNTDLSSPVTGAPAGPGRNLVNSPFAAGITFATTTNFGPAGLMPLAPAGVTITPVSTALISLQSAWSTAQAVISGPTTFEHSAVLQRVDPNNVLFPFVTRHRASQVLESVLDELASVRRTEDGRRRTEERLIPDFFRPLSAAVPPFGEPNAPMASDVALLGTGFQRVSKIPTVSLTIARGHQIDASVARWYHCVTGCVRRAFLGRKLRSKLGAS